MTTTSRLTKIIGAAMLGAFVYAMIGTATFRMAAAKWGTDPRLHCPAAPNARKCHWHDTRQNWMMTAGILWPIGLPIVTGIAAGGKLKGTESALAKPTDSALGR